MCVERENPLYIYKKHSKLAAISPPAQGGGLRALSLIFRRFPGPVPGQPGRDRTVCPARRASYRRVARARHSRVRT